MSKVGPKPGGPTKEQPKMYVVWTRPKTAKAQGRAGVAAPDPKTESDLEQDSSTATVWTNYGGNVTTDANLTDTDEEQPDRYAREGESDWMKPDHAEKKKKKKRKKGGLCMCCGGPPKKSKKRKHNDESPPKENKR